MNQIKLFFFFVLSFFNCYYAISQKQMVAIAPFVSSADNKAKAEQLQEVALECLNARSNIQLIDRSKDAQLLDELNKSIREVSADSKIHVAQNEVSNAQDLLVGNLTSVSTEERKANLLSGKVKYVADISFSLQIFDVATGVQKSTKVFNGNLKKQDVTTQIFKKGLAGKASELLLADTKDEAILKAIKATNNEITDWINTQYPPDAKILSVDTKDDKGLPDNVSVVGLTTGLTKGTVITVNEVTILKDGSKEYRKVKKIGELKVVENQDEVTECKVTSGADIIGSKWNSGVKLEFLPQKKML